MSIPKMMRRTRMWALLGVMAMMTACNTGGELPAPTATTGPTPRPFVTQAPNEPTATTPPEPTATTLMEATATQASFPGVMTQFPPDVNPLTGEQVSDPEVLNHSPLLIKVSNAPSVVRPQDGLQSADLVFQHYAEWGLTRFTAVFWDTLPQRVGSDRSMRLIDLELPAIYQGILAFSGSSAGVREKLLSTDFYREKRALSPALGQGAPMFYRVPNGKALEHTLFVNAQALRKEAIRRGVDKRPDLTGMGFSTDPPPGGAAATQLTVKYQAATAHWEYDPASGRYLRWDDGRPNSDELTGKQLSAANVGVIYANHVTTLILEDANGSGAYSIEIQLWGSGPMKLFRDGQVFDGTWHRTERNSMLTFTGSDGQVLPFKVGNSWFQLVPLNFSGLAVK